MMPPYKIGERLRSRVSTAEIVVVRSPGTELDITCAGVRLARDGEDRGTETPVDGADRIELGKRYEDRDSGLEVLCVVAGGGPLAAGGRVMPIKSAKPLPASD
jgi:hypothetical protein